jgi:hypothetical protein
MEFTQSIATIAAIEDDVTSVVVITKSLYI